MLLWHNKARRGTEAGPGHNWSRALALTWQDPQHWSVCNSGDRLQNQRFVETRKMRLPTAPDTGGLSRVYKDL